MEQKTIVNTELEPRPEAENAKTGAVLSLKQIQEDVALQKKYAKAQFRLSVARTCMTAVLFAVVAALVLLGMQRVQSTLARVDAMMTQLEAIDLTGIAQSVEVLEQQGNSLAAAATEKLDGALVEFRAALESMQGVDFAALQQSIDDFSSLIGPIKAFFGR